MAEEKKYEITISDLSAYIGAAAFEILPEDAKEEDVDKYAMVAAGITDRVAKHLDGSDPLPEDHVALAKEMGQFINELGVVCEKIVYNRRKGYLGSFTVQFSINKGWGVIKTYYFPEEDDIQNVLQTVFENY